jgi:hypothetical protein
MRFDVKQATHWANVDTESGDYVRDGMRVARLGCQDWRGHHLREALAEIERLRGLALEACETGMTVAGGPTFDRLAAIRKELEGSGE